jgi:hypothetical protein
MQANALGVADLDEQQLGLGKRREHSLNNGIIAMVRIAILYITVRTQGKISWSAQGLPFQAVFFSMLKVRAGMSFTLASILERNVRMRD